MTGGMAEVDAGVGTGLPFGCTNGARLVGGVEDVDGATPGVEGGRYHFVCQPCEFLEWAFAIFIKGEPIMSLDNCLDGIRP